MTWNRVLRIWWVIAWRGLVGYMLSTWLLLAFVVVVQQATDNPLAGILAILALAAPPFWSIIAIRMALKKQYAGFRIELR